MGIIDPRHSGIGVDSILLLGGHQSEHAATVTVHRGTSLSQGLALSDNGPRRGLLPPTTGAKKPAREPPGGNAVSLSGGTSFPAVVRMTRRGQGPAPSSGPRTGHQHFLEAPGTVVRRWWAVPS